MIICEIKHSNYEYDKHFVFQSPVKIAEGMWVMCDTSKGECPGLVCECFEVDETTPLFKRYLKLMGATEPLKEVTGVFVPLSLLTRWIKKK